jgi:hypothetical protein
VRDVVSGPGRGLCGVVAGVERIDPSTRHRPVVLGQCGGCAFSRCSCSVPSEVSVDVAVTANPV